MSGWDKSKEIILDEIKFKGKRVLDVGCGNGWFSYWAKIKGALVDAIDPSEEQIKEAKSIDKNNSINFINIGAENINDLKNVYDLIFFFNSLHHIPMYIMEKALQYSKNTINNYGSIYIIEPIAEGKFHDFVKNIDDETKVRNEAYKVINNCDKYKLEIIKEIIYDEVKVFNNGDDCINFLSKVDTSRLRYIKDNKKFLLNEFNRLSNYSNNKYKFIQPMRLNILKNKI